MLSVPFSADYYADLAALFFGVAWALAFVWGFTSGINTH